MDFNCLDLVISVESWVVVIDFFSASPSSSSRGASAVNVSVPSSEGSQSGECRVINLKHELIHLSNLCTYSR